MFWSQSEPTSTLRDKLAGALIGLARATEGNEHAISDSTSSVTMEGLFILMNEHFDDAKLLSIMEKIKIEKQKLVPDCFLCAYPCGRTTDYDLTLLWYADEEIRNLKLSILSGICKIASNTYHSSSSSPTDESLHNLLYKALFSIGTEDWGMEELLPIIQEVNEVNGNIA